MITLEIKTSLSLKQEERFLKYLSMAIERAEEWYCVYENTEGERHFIRVVGSGVTSDE